MFNFESRKYQEQLSLSLKIHAFTARGRFFLKFIIKLFRKEPKHLQDP